MQIRQDGNKFYRVYQGSADLGAFWFGNGTMYAKARNSPFLMGVDIGLMDMKDAAQWVQEQYSQNKNNGQHKQ